MSLKMLTSYFFHCLVYPIFIINDNKTRSSFWLYRMSKLERTIEMISNPLVWWINKLRPTEMTWTKCVAPVLVSWHLIQVLSTELVSVKPVGLRERMLGQVAFQAPCTSNILWFQPPNGFCIFFNTYIPPLKILFTDLNTFRNEAYYPKWRFRSGGASDTGQLQRGHRC